MNNESLKLLNSIKIFLKFTRIKGSYNVIQINDSPNPPLQYRNLNSERPKRKKREAIEADQTDIKELENLSSQLKEKD